MDLPNQKVTFDLIGDGATKSNSDVFLSTTEDSKANIQSVITVNITSASDMPKLITALPVASNVPERETLSRRPSYRRILNDLSRAAAEQEEGKDESQSDTSLESSSVLLTDVAEPRTAEGNEFQVTDPTSNLQTNKQKAEGPTKATMAIPNLQNIFPITSNSIYGENSIPDDVSQTTSMWVPVQTMPIGFQAFPLQESNDQLVGGIINSSRLTSQSAIQTPQQMAEEASRKREMRLMKNRDAAKECRRRKKEYVKCLEARVTVLEHQNKQLISELKALKNLYMPESVVDSS